MSISQHLSCEAHWVKSGYCVVITFVRENVIISFSSSLGNLKINSTLMLHLFLLRFCGGHFIVPDWFIFVILFWLAAVFIKWLSFFLGLTSFSSALYALARKGMSVEKNQPLVSWFIRGPECWNLSKNRFHLREQLF